MNRGHQVAIPLALALEIRDALEQADRDREILAKIRALSGDLNRSARRAPDMARMRRELREHLGESALDHVPGEPVRRDTSKGMPAVFCEHANEVPHYCPCDEGCYCKQRTCAG